MDKKNVLFITSSHNSMSQRFYVELTQRGYDVSIHVTSTEDAMREAVRLVEPDFIICPFLNTAVPEDIWRAYTCIIVHPGIQGDRGPSSMDWAIYNGDAEWGVTLLQADEEMDAGDIYASRNYAMRPVGKSTLYRHEAATAAVEGLLHFLDNRFNEAYVPEPLNYDDPSVKGTLLPTMKQAVRTIDWKSDDTETILRKIRSADSNPGVLDTFLFRDAYYVYGAHEEDTLTGAIGELIAYRDDAVCVGTKDGSLWISHVKKKGGIKLPATMALAHLLVDVPHVPYDAFATNAARTYREIWYTEEDGVGYIHFDFYNGAMHTMHCHKLKEVIVEAKKRDVRVLVLMGGADFWSNGIHLNTIEASLYPDLESWDNINAIDDVVLALIQTPNQYVISAMQGNSGAGGVILALAADSVFAREGAVMNPHYQKMGGLYGSEYWTYLLPKRVGVDKANFITTECLPMGTQEGVAIGLLDDAFGHDVASFVTEVKERARVLAQSPELATYLVDKRQLREADELHKPLAAYRAEELEHMKRNFFGADRAYHTARTAFVRKISCATVPVLMDLPKPMQHQ